MLEKAIYSQMRSLDAKTTASVYWKVVNHWITKIPK